MNKSICTTYADNIALQFGSPVSPVSTPLPIPRLTRQAASIFSPAYRAVPLSPSILSHSVLRLCPPQSFDSVPAESSQALAGRLLSPHRPSGLRPPRGPLTAGSTTPSVTMKLQKSCSQPDSVLSRLPFSLPQPLKMRPILRSAGVDRIYIPYSSLSSRSASLVCSLHPQEIECFHWTSV